MSHFNQAQTQAANPAGPGATSDPAAEGPYSAPPPAGYPTKDGQALPHDQQAAPPATRSRADGFLKGCLAALCCCCAVEECC